MRRSVWMLSVFSLFLLPQPGTAAEIGVKSLAGPPEEFAAQRLPSAQEIAVPSTLLMVDRGGRESAGKAIVPPGGTSSSFSTSAGVGFSVIQATTQYPVFAPATIFGPDGSQYFFDGTSIVCNFGFCDEFTADIQMEPFAGSAGGMAVFSISGGVVGEGTWDLAVQAPGPLPLVNGVVPEIETLVSFDDNVVEVAIDPDPCGALAVPICPFSARATGFDLVDGAMPVLRVSFATKDMKRLGIEAGLSLTGLGVTVTDARTRRTIHQERLSPARLAALPTDGVGANLVQLPALPAGEYSVRLDVEGHVPGIGKIERTAVYFLPILARGYDLTGEVGVEAIDKERLELRLEIAATEDTRHVYGYAEVWTGDGRKPIAWIGGMTQPTLDRAGRLALSMVLDTRWLALAGVLGSELELRNVRIQDADTFIPLGRARALPFTAPAGLGALGGPAAVTTDESLYVGKGDRTITVADSAPGVAPNGGFTNTGIFLVHGWCSGITWPFSHFGRPGRVGGTEEFFDPSASRSHDAFAREIRDQGAARFIDSFTVVAHSQGGAAAIHLRSFYTSLLDLSNAPRRIQTMGTPYNGSTLMDYYLATGPLGWIIGSIFGGCGPSFDLSTLGSALWRSSLPSWSRGDVWYYRTGYRRARTFWERVQFWRWRCNFASFVIPGWDDGVVADWQGTLSGAHDMGVTESECHTGGMNHAAQTGNFGRNDILDREGRPQNINLARTATATASSTYTPGCSPGIHCYFPSRVNDGDRSTALGGNTSWSNNGGAMPQWVQLNWSTPITFSRVNLWLTAGYEMTWFVVEYQPIGSSSWVSIATVTGNASSVVGPYNTTPVSTQRIRVRAVSGSALQPGYARVNEFEVY